MSKSRKARRCAASVFSFLGTLILLVVIIGCIPAVAPRLLDCRVYSVISGSMEPAIPVGSLVYVEPIPAADIVQGDVIAFYDSVGSGAIVVHRVVDNQVLGGKLTTKGDANDTEDLSPVSYDRYQGKVTFTVPYLGQILHLLSTRPGKIAAISVISLAAVLHAIAALLRGFGEKEEE